MQHVRVLSPVLAQPTVRIPWRCWLAKTVSIVFSPPLLGILGLALLGLELDSTAAWLWTAFYTVANILAPVAYILILMRKGELTDYHMRERAERIKPMKAFLLFFLLSWLIFLAGGAPYLFQVLAMVGALQSAVMLLITSAGRSAAMARA